MKYVCASQDGCTVEELHDLLQEMDRRFFLVQDLRWEFSLLDREQKDTITEHQAMYGYCFCLATHSGFCPFGVGWPCTQTLLIFIQMLGTFIVHLLHWFGIIFTPSIVFLCQLILCLGIPILSVLIVGK